MTRRGSSFSIQLCGTHMAGYVSTFVLVCLIVRSIISTFWVSRQLFVSLRRESLVALLSGRAQPYTAERTSFPSPIQAYLVGGDFSRIIGSGVPGEFALGIPLPLSCRIRRA